MENSIEKKLARIPSGTTHRHIKISCFLLQPRLHLLALMIFLMILFDDTLVMVRTYRFLLRRKSYSISMEFPHFRGDISEKS